MKLARINTENSFIVHPNTYSLGIRIHTYVCNRANVRMNRVFVSALLPYDVIVHTYVAT